MIPKLKVLIKQNQRGSATIEFIGMVPFVFMMLLVVWQFFVAGFAVFSIQTAANEAAKVYAATNDSSKAEIAAQEILAANANLYTPSGNYSTISTLGSSAFTSRIDVQLKILFLPDEILGYNATIPIQREVKGRRLE
ncbi:TadE/TadG family type IV pilus assembly protein [Halalkalibacter urbisdiaboli]|uniref:TadE/TadG family type IV pilus assembly protein n=1 Tax=Halalkalibacter urbisdiaboli TaxID=1960589 RepID=UPI000B451267|nr:TadE family protein [Halalkalibacter urbisdiaboli]